jgi:hypothetical protein
MVAADWLGKRRARGFPHLFASTVIPDLIPAFARMTIQVTAAA